MSGKRVTWRCCRFRLIRHASLSLCRTLRGGFPPPPRARPARRRPLRRPPPVGRECSEGGGSGNDSRRRRLSPVVLQSLETNFPCCRLSPLRVSTCHHRAAFPSVSAARSPRRPSRSAPQGGQPCACAAPHAPRACAWRHCAPREAGRKREGQRGHLGAIPPISICVPT